MEQITKHLSYANVVATLALVFAMTGGAVAATGGFTAASSGIRACAGSGGVLKLQTGKKCKKGQKAVRWNAQGVPGAKGAAGVPGPSGIAGLNGAPVPSATTAATANNALALGGVPASGFTQRSCASDTGQVKGFAQIPAVIPATFSRVTPVYSCSGGAVEARQIETGVYEFKFAGNLAEIGLASAEAGGSTDVTTAVNPEGNGSWVVLVSRDDSVVNRGLTLVLF